MPTRFILAAAVVIMHLGNLAAQEPNDSDGPVPQPRPISFSAAGIHVVPLRADRVRVLIPLIAHALSTDEAIDLLRERKESAAERVRGLNAVMESIRFGGVGVEDSESQMESSSRVLMMINARGNALDLDELPVLYTARVDMTVDWRLPEADEEARLLFVERIVTALKEPDVTGKDDRPEFSPKVEEALSTIRDQAMQYYSAGNRADSDAIRYAYIANVPRKTVEEAVRRALDDARSQVEVMTRAAGLEMGQLASMSSSTGSRYAQTVSTPYTSSVRADLLVPGPDEAAAAREGELKYVAQVHTQFNAAPIAQQP